MQLEYDVEKYNVHKDNFHIDELQFKIKKNQMGWIKKLEQQTI